MSRLRRTFRKNEQGKTRGVNEPYEIWQAGPWEWRVLKKYQSPDREAENKYARWFCAVKSPYTHDAYDLGDTYVIDIKELAIKMRDEEMEGWLKENQWREYG